MIPANLQNLTPASHTNSYVKHQLEKKASLTSMLAGGVQSPERKSDDDEGRSNRHGNEAGSSSGNNDDDDQTAHTVRTGGSAYRISMRYFMGLATVN